MRTYALALLALSVACGGSTDTDPSAQPAETPPARPAAPARPLPPPLPGVDIGGLSDTEKRAFFDTLEAVNSPCGQAMTIAACVRDGAQCPDCRHAARYLARLLSQGYPAELAKQMIGHRYAADQRLAVDVEGCAFRGNVEARVTLVEFADFECPHCREAHHELDQLFEDTRVASTARLCYRFFPLDGHENARPAARAAVAAMNQGKFWPMHDALYEHQTELSPTFYTTTATSLGLDLTRFRTDFDAPETEARVQRDKDQGRALDIQGTPSLFVNSRRYEGSTDPDSLRAYILEELER